MKVSIKEHQKKRAIKSYVLRQGRMTSGQQRGIDNGWSKWGLKIKDGFVDNQSVFGRQAPLVLEIGYGMGLSLIEMAKEEKDKNFIGIEVHFPGVGSLLNEAQKEGLTNLRTYHADAIEVIKYCIEDLSLDRIQIYFPDPWHKKRHNKRRLIQVTFAHLVLSKLKVGGIIHLATDWEPYAEHMMGVLSGFSELLNLQGIGEFCARPAIRPITKFEQRGYSLGHKVWDLLFKKVD